MNNCIPENIVRVPNLFIVGASKSGTTSLWYLLRQHPDVFIPEDELYKEPGYLSDLYGMTDQDKYLSLFAKASCEKYVGEATTAYLTDPNSAQRIYEFNPDSKIIIMLRHPVMRAYSLYNWMVQEGYEYAGTFEDALLKEDKRKHRKIPNFFEPSHYYNYMYYSSGLYHVQIERYVNIFGKNVFIGLFEDFIKDEVEFLKQLSNFLGINCYIMIDKSQPQNTSRKVINPSCLLITRKLISNLQRLAIKLKLSEPYKSKSKRDFYLKYFTMSQKPDPVNLQTYKYLLNQYREEYEILENNFSLNLEAWRKIDDKQMR